MSIEKDVQLRAESAKIERRSQQTTMGKNKESHETIPSRGSSRKINRDVGTP